MGGGPGKHAKISCIRHAARQVSGSRLEHYASAYVLMPGLLLLLAGKLLLILQRPSPIIFSSSPEVTPTMQVVITLLPLFLD